ncbi:MAG: MATE family efflux transporter [Rhizobiaceae bacterium]
MLKQVLRVKGQGSLNYTKFSAMAVGSSDQIKPGVFEVNHGLVVRLALPMTLAYLSTPLLGLVDTAVVGRLGDPAIIGGLAVGSVIISLVFTTFNFQRSGTTGLAAQAVGTGDEKEKQAIFMRALLLAAVFGIATILLAPLLLTVGLWFMKPGEAVGNATQTYFSIRVWSTPFTLLNYAVLGWLIGLGRAGLALAVQTLLNGSNIVLSIALGLGLGYGIAGVAWATVIAEIITAGAGLLICRNLMDKSIRPSRQRILDRSALKRLINLNGDIMIRSFVLLLGFAFFTAQGARLGELTLAANAILMNFVMIAGYFLDGLATAAEQIVGRAVGAKHRPAFVRGVQLTFLWNGLLSLLLFALFYVAGGWLIDVMTTNEEVRDTARAFLLFAALTPLTGFPAFQLDGIYIGATWSRVMSQMMVVSFVVYLLSWYGLLQSWGNTGLWLALHVFLLCRGITLGARLVPKMHQTFEAS